jgi:hypothetical protein
VRPRGFFLSPLLLSWVNDGQVELLTEYLDGSPESRCAATQLRQMAEDAEAGLPRAVLETVADLVHTVSGCDGPTRLQARLQTIDWETVQANAAMLYHQRSTGKLRACTLSARGPLSPELISVTVRFLRCGATKQVPLIRASLYEMDEELVDMPYDYSVAHSGWENVDDDKRRDANSPIDQLQQRRLKVQYFSLKKKAIYMHMPSGMRHNKADQKTLLGLFEQQRRGNVVAFKQQRKDGELSTLQQRLLGVHTPASMRAIWSERRLEVHLTLSDDYLKARVSALAFAAMELVPHHGVFHRAVAGRRLACSARPRLRIFRRSDFLRVCDRVVHAVYNGGQLPRCVDARGRVSHYDARRDARCAPTH